MKKFISISEAEMGTLDESTYDTTKDIITYITSIVTMEFGSKVILGEQPDGCSWKVNTKNMLKTVEAALADVDKLKKELVKFKNVVVKRANEE